jgi:preprotein translocase subunit SecA
MLEKILARRARWRGEHASAAYPERAEPEPSRLDRLITDFHGSVAFALARGRDADLARMADAVDAFAPDFQRLSDDQLRPTADGLRAELTRRGFALAIAARSFALIRETSARVLGLRHHRSQLMGGWAMLKGGLAEMETGEGKTITALLPAATAALANHPVHVVTVNAYLAERDAAQLRPVYEALGLTVGLVQPGQGPDERRAAYDCDVAYCTNSDLVFDYLRDRMALGQRRGRSRILIDELLNAGAGSASSPLLLRGLQFAVVDEADSVFIDEAKTPLVLSGGRSIGGDSYFYNLALSFARQLVRDEDFHLEGGSHAARLTTQGQLRLVQLVAGAGSAADDVLWRSRRARHELAEQALAALHLYRLDQHYIVAGGKVQIVDEYTGRVMPDRSWERGLHQMIEAKEACEVTEQRRTQARITYQRFFRRYLKLSGMSGTAGEAAGELAAVFGLKVVRIPTHRRLRRRHLGTRLYATAAEKWQAVTVQVQQMRRAARPVLIGTRSVAASERVSHLLIQAGLAEHDVLNARQDKREADIVAAAGGPGRITVATNMAGRGTDIKLAPEVAKSGGLHVILTEFHESARIDRQLFGRCARQGDPGSVEAIVSLEDELFVRFVGPGWRRLAAVLIATRHFPGCGDGLSRHVGGLLRWYAQRNAERLHAKIRRQTVDQDRLFDKSLAFAGKSE